MADEELKRLLEGLFSDIPTETIPKEVPVREPWDAQERERLAARFQAVARLSQAASSILSLDELLPQVADLIKEQFGYYYVGIFLVDEEGDWAVLKAGTGEAGRRLIEQGHRVEIDDHSMVGWCIANQRARIALDVGGESVRFVNPLLPNTRSELALPLTSRGRVIGAMTIQSAASAAFGQEDITLLQIIADHLAIAIENARLFEEGDRRITELAMVNEIGQALSTAQGLDDLLPAVHQQVGRLFDTTNFYIATYDEGSNYWTSAFHLERGERQPRARYGIEAGLTGHIIRNRRPLLFRSLEENIAFSREQRTEIIGEVARSWLGVPLITADKLVGVMAIQDYQRENLYNEQDLALFSTLATQVATALDNLRLVEEARRRAQQLETINEVGRAVTSVLDLDAVLRQIVDITKARFGHYYVSILLVEGEQLVFRAGSTVGASGVRAESTQLKIDPFQGPSLYAEAARTRQPVLVNDVLRDARFLAREALPATRAELDVPIEVRGQVIGVLSVQSDQRFAYDETDVALLQLLASQAGVAIENARLFEEMEARAEEQAILYHITEAISRSLAREDLLKTTITETMKAVGYDAALVSLWNEDSGQLYLAAEQGLPEPMARTLEQHGLAGTLCDYVFQLGKTVFIGDVRRGAPVDVQGLLQHGLLTYLGIPLEYRGRSEGTICFFGREVRESSPQHIALLEAIGRQIVIGLDNARLFEQTQAALAEVEAVHRSYLRRGWQEHLRQREMLGRSGFLYDRIQTARPEDAIADPELWRPEMERALVDGGTAIAREDSKAGGRSGLAVPISLRGQTFGVLGIESPTSDYQWSEDDIALIQAVGDQLAQTLETARLFADTQRRAERERLISEITTKLRASADMENIIKTAAVELGQALGTSRALVRVGIEQAASRGAESTAEATEEARPGEDEQG